MSIGKEEVEELTKTNNGKLLDMFKGLLQQTVSQIKRPNEESAESQMKEIKRLKFNEPHKFKKRQTRTSSSLTRSKTLDSAKTTAEHSQLDKVKNDLEEGEKLISERQKLIFFWPISPITDRLRSPNIKCTA